MSNYTQSLLYIAISMIKDKWVDEILMCLHTGPKRFSELEKSLTGISKKVLSSKLHQLEQNRLIDRHIIPTSPIKTQYCLSDFSVSLKPVFKAIYFWEEKYRAYNKIDNINLKPTSLTLRLLEKKWKIGIINCIRYDTKRISELQKDLHPVSKKMLIEHLKEMENDGLIIKNTYDEMPPRVEYELSPLGQELVPIIDMFKVWGENYQRNTNIQEKIHFD